MCPNIAIGPIGVDNRTCHGGRGYFYAIKIDRMGIIGIINAISDMMPAVTDGTGRKIES